KRDDKILTTDEVFSVKKIPPTMLIVGGGYNGVELGSCFAALGSKVTIVELMDRMLIGTDADMVRIVRKHMEERGIQIHLEAKVVDATPGKDKVQVKVQPKEGAEWSASYDLVLLAIGRRPNTDEIGLDKAGVKLNERGFIVIDEQCRTSAKHIFAIG